MNNDEIITLPSPSPSPQSASSRHAPRARGGADPVREHCDHPRKVPKERVPSAPVSHPSLCTKVEAPMQLLLKKKRPDNRTPSPRGQLCRVRRRTHGAGDRLAEAVTAFPEDRSIEHPPGT